MLSGESLIVILQKVPFKFTSPTLTIMRTETLFAITSLLIPLCGYAADEKNPMSMFGEEIDAKFGNHLEGVSVRVDGSYREYNGDFASGGDIRTTIEFSTIFVLGSQPNMIFRAEPYNQYGEGQEVVLSRDLSIYHDGKNWYTLISSKTRKDGSLKDIKQVNIDTTKPNLIGDVLENFVTAEALFLSDLMFYEGRNISSLFDGEAPYIGDLEIKDSGDDIFVSLLNDCAQYTLEFNRSNFSPSKYTKTLGLCGDGNIIEIKYEYTFEGNSLAHLSMDIEYPSEIKRYYSYNGRTEYSAVLKIDGISLSEIKNEEYIPTIPSGWWIHDKRNDIVFKSGESKSEILESLKIVD